MDASRVSLQPLIGWLVTPSRRMVCMHNAMRRWDQSKRVCCSSRTLLVECERARANNVDALDRRQMTTSWYAELGPRLKTNVSHGTVHTYLVGRYRIDWAGVLFLRSMIN